MVPSALEVPISRSRSLLRRSGQRPPLPNVTPAPAERRDAPPPPPADLPFDVSPPAPDRTFATGEDARPAPSLPAAFQEPAPVEVLDETAPLLDYARQNQPRSQRKGLHLTGEIPILRDLPFGKQPGYGGETPFALSTPGERSVAESADENQGIPTGLPPVLARLETVEVGPLPEPPDDGPEVDDPPTPLSSELAALQRSLQLANQRARGLMILGLISGFLSGLLAAGLLR